MKIRTVWEVYSYDVWGNAADGYDVNDVFSRGTVQLLAQVEYFDNGKPKPFIAAYLTDGQLRKVFRTFSKLSVDGDDLHYEISRQSDNLPIGRLYCISHQSLSPIKL
jgi:hypothetical protein